MSNTDTPTWADPQPVVGATYLSRDGRTFSVRRVAAAQHSFCPACEHPISKPAFVIARVIEESERVRRVGAPLTLSPEDWGGLGLAMVKV